MCLVRLSIKNNLMKNGRDNVKKYCVIMVVNVNVVASIRLIFLKLIILMVVGISIVKLLVDILCHGLLGIISLVFLGSYVLVVIMELVYMEFAHIKENRPVIINELYFIESNGELQLNIMVVNAHVVASQTGRSYTLIISKMMERSIEGKALK